MTVDQVLYVASRIHDWEKEPREVAGRALQVVLSCERAVEVKEKFDGMEAKGLSLSEMIAEVTKESVATNATKE